MNRKWQFLGAAPIAGLFVSSCYAAIEPLKRLVPPDAKSVDFRRIGNGKQVSYSVPREYPAYGIQKDALDLFRKEGWAYCNKKGEPEWSSFLDATGGQRERVYQRLSYLKKGDRLITIGERYYAKTPAQLQPGGESHPDDNAQEVVIVEGKLNTKQLSELLASGRATCEPTSK